MMVQRRFPDLGTRVPSCVSRGSRAKRSSSHPLSRSLSLHLSLTHSITLSPPHPLTLVSTDIINSCDTNVQ